MAHQQPHAITFIQRVQHRLASPTSDSAFDSQLHRPVVYTRVWFDTPQHSPISYTYSCGRCPNLTQASMPRAISLHAPRAIHHRELGPACHFQYDLSAGLRRTHSWRCCDDTLQFESTPTPTRDQPASTITIRLPVPSSTPQLLHSRYNGMSAGALSPLWAGT